MDTDELVRWLILSLGGVGLFAYILGGVLTRVAGVWHDGQHPITLNQLGPWVWGEASWPSGRQAYRGRALWGWVRLTRADYGADHLRNLGFDQEQLAVIAGEITGHLQMRLLNDTLVGRFFGRKFSFEQDGKKMRIKDVQVVPAAERTWRRHEASP